MRHSEPGHRITGAIVISYSPGRRARVVRPTPPFTLQAAKTNPSLRFIGAMFAGGGFPFLAAVAMAVLFDSRGGEPFSASVMALFLYSPLLVLIGVAVGVACYRHATVMKCFGIADALLLAVIVLRFPA